MIADWRLGAVVKSLISKGILLMLVISAGCAVQPAAGPAELQFAVLGKFGIRDGDEGYAARFEWRHYANEYHIDVWGPLGQGRTQLRGNARSMQVSRGEEMLAQGPPDQVMYDYLGWSVPVEVLPAWLAGRPQDARTYYGAVHDASGRFTQFHQAGWEVQLSGFTPRTDTGASLVTPAKIVAQNGLRKVTVAVRDFKH
jgi:outer membrane lipoprotein LolB